MLPWRCGKMMRLVTVRAPSRSMMPIRNGRLRMIQTAAVELGAAAIPLFEDFIRRNPESPAAHEMLSEVRAEWGAGDRFADSYAAALQRSAK